MWAHLVLPSQRHREGQAVLVVEVPPLWGSVFDILGDIMLSQVRWKESHLEPDITQAAIPSSSHINGATHLALLSWCPSSQKRHLHIPEKKILS